MSEANNDADTSSRGHRKNFSHQASSFLAGTMRRLSLTGRTIEISLPHELHEAQTSDGWALSFKHYAPSETASTRRTTPVMLVHGLSSNHHIYDLRQEQSLSWMLCELGYDVWLIDLRGSGLSEKSRKAKKATNWDLHAYVADIKVAVDTITAYHNVEQVHFVGHSLGGILGLVLMGAYPEYSQKIKSLTTLASALFYEDSWWAKLKPMLPLADVIDFIDLTTLMRLYSPFVVWPSFVCHMTNVARSDLQKVLNKVEKVPTKVFKDMGSAFNPDGLALDFGNGAQPVQDLMKNVHQPTLMLAADFDRQCSVPSVRRTIELLASTKKRCIVCGPKPEYHHHYGHMDILVGTRTATEVFPHVADFLQECDDPGFVSPRREVAADEAVADEDQAEEPLDVEEEEEGGVGGVTVEQEEEYIKLKGVMHDVIGVDCGEALSPVRDRKTKIHWGKEQVGPVAEAK